MNNKLKMLFLLCIIAIQLSLVVNGQIFDWKSVNQNTQRVNKIVCYYTNWAQYRPKPGAYYPEDIDPNLCTHIIFAFAKINDNSELEAFEWNDVSTEWSKGMYERTMALKEKNKDLKIMLAVGGWNMGSLPFSNMVSNDAKRKNFVKKTVQFMKTHKFDGLDLDWEYPANRDTEDRPSDKTYFTTLCRELYDAFRPHNMLLSAAVAAGIKYIRSAYELDKIHNYLDFINLMAYDLHGGWDNTTGHNAPLYAHEFDKDKTLNVDFAVKTWLEQVPPEKMILGVASYGRSFKLKDGFDSCPHTGIPTIENGGVSGKFSRENGFLTYYEICEKMLLDKWKYVWIEQQKVPFAYSNEILSNPSAQIDWVGFDDVQSIAIKAKYILDNNLGGGMLWSLDMDDFTGSFCNQGKYPILRTLNHYLNPKFKYEKPDGKLMWNLKEKNATKPAQESEMITRLKENEKISFERAESMSKDVMLIYKYCQCKNGSIRIDSSKAFVEDFYALDCNLKRVISRKEFDYEMEKEQNRNQTSTKKAPKDNKKTDGDSKEKEDNFWSIFGFGNSGSSVQSSYSNFLFIFALFVSYLFSN